MKINTERETEREKPQFSDMQRIDLQNRLMSVDHQYDFATMDFTKLKQIELNTFVIKQLFLNYYHIHYFLHNLLLYLYI